MNDDILGADVRCNGLDWTVWSHAPGPGCVWLSRRVDGKAVFVKARMRNGEWIEVLT